MIYRGYTIERMQDEYAWKDERGFYHEGYPTEEAAMDSVDAYKRRMREIIANKGP